MRKRIIVLTAVLAMQHVDATEKPCADVFLNVTSDLPKWSSNTGYSGYFSVTNTGTVPFVVVTDEEWSGETTRFYREGDGERQRMEDEFWGARQWKENERINVADNYHFCLDQKKPHTVLKPGEGITFKCENFNFNYRFSAPIDIYKAEMYLGNDTWGPVTITPTLGTLFAVSVNNGKVDGDFYYSKEGTNQYLYFKDGGRFKRVGEMKLGSAPRQEQGAVLFDSPDGVRKKFSHTEARQAIRDSEQNLNKQ